MTSHVEHPDHKKAYAGVLFALLALTAVTVWTSYHDFGVVNIVVAMGIATIKASLVVLIFMGLKYDNKTNAVIFISSFVFLAIFVGLTMADVAVRPNAEPVVVTAVEPPAASQSAQMEELRKPTLQLLARGKEVFAANCVACHGPEGKGDGPAAAAFNPKPRNFVEADWKNGGTPGQLFVTLTKGVNSMPSFSALPVRDLWAVVHFIRSLAPKDRAPEDTPETLKLIGLEPGAQAAVPSKITPEIPVDFIMKRMVEEKK